MLDDKLMKSISFGGGENVGGTRHIDIMIAKREWFATIGETKNREDALTFEELVTISTDHTFLTDYGFIKTKITPKTGNIESASAGEMDGKVKNDIFSFNVAGSTAEVLGFEKYFLNEDLDLMGKHLDCALQLMAKHHGEKT